MTDMKTVSDATWRFLNDPSDPRHGTFNGYNNLGCRCTPCKAANTARMKQSRETSRTKTPPRHVHGTENGYRYWGCKCERCKKAWSDATSRRRKAVKEPAV